MSLNEIQKQYVENVHRGVVLPDCVIEDLSSVEGRAYKSDSFRELLFALDATNLLHGLEWAKLFGEGLLTNSGWLDEGIVRPATFTEIGEYHERYGRGENSIGLLLDMTERANKMPSNVQSFTRRTIREHFTGIQPVTPHALFLLKRYFEARAPLLLEDVELLLYINEETKGLDNSPRWDRLVATLLRDAVLAEMKDSPGPVWGRVRHALEHSDEVTAAEKLTIRMMVDEELDVPEALLQRIDLSQLQLFGMA